MGGRCLRRVIPHAAALIAAAVSVTAIDAVADVRPAIAQGLQRCKIPHPVVSFVVPNDWACEAGSPTGLRFRAEAPGQTAFIDFYTAPSTETVGSLVSTAIKAHGLAHAGAHPHVTSKRATVAGRPAVVYAVDFPGTFDDFVSGQIRDSVYVFTRSGFIYVIAYSSVDPYAKRDARDFATFVGSLHFVVPRHFS